MKTRPIIGFIRFSFFGPSDTRIRYDDLEAAAAKLYSPERMATRFHYFERLCLPSLKAQTDQDFRILILTSEVMPQIYRDRLAELVADMPTVTIIWAKTRDARREFAPHFIERSEDGMVGEAVLFRFDDDDALDRNYIANLREISKDAPATTHISFPKGLALFSDKDLGVCAEQTRNMAHAQGLAMVIGGAFSKNPFMMMHSDVWRRFPLRSDPTPFSYIRCYHTHTDTVDNQAKNLQQMKNAIIKRGPSHDESPLDAQIRDSFPWLTLDSLREIMASAPKG